jgi:uncharacterized OB-fold protein
MIDALDEAGAGVDWTDGHPAILYQQCGDCRRVWYFRRSFCPHCGSGRVDTRPASGRGAIYATTLVSRAPSERLRAFAPYRIVLVDAEEGFRMMAHGAQDLTIGDHVAARFQPFGSLLIPFFERWSSRVLDSRSDACRGRASNG